MKNQFLIFWIFLIVGLSTVTFNSCSSKKGITDLHHDEGVIINGVKWATRNVDKPGTFAAKPEDAGMFYQWNRKKAWTVTGNVTNWNATTPEGDTWEKANDPSPTGWRVPTLVEIESLFDADKVNNKWVTQNGVKGRKFTDKATGASIFLPVVGFRSHRDGTLDDAGSYGNYWGSTAHEVGETSVYYLTFYIADAYRSYAYSRNGLSVRAVAE